MGQKLNVMSFISSNIFIIFYFERLHLKRSKKGDENERKTAKSVENRRKSFILLYSLFEVQCSKYIMLFQIFCSLTC